MTVPPKGLTGRPEVASPLDVVSQVLDAVRLTGDVLFTCSLSEPWAVSSPPGELIGPMILPRARCFAMFHVVTTGECSVEVDGMQPWPLEAADVVVLPKGDGHTMRGSIATTVRSIAEILPPTGVAGCPEVVHGGGGRETRLVCGFLACDHRFNPLVSALPRLLRVRSGGRVFASSDDGGDAPRSLSLPPDAAAWFDASLRHALVELTSARAGGRTVMTRLMELLLVQALRSCVSGTGQGWLAALSDPRVGPALAALHHEPARSWRIDLLARRVGTSRSVLAERFTALLGEPPMRYLARWRVQLARNLLLDTDAGIAEVASKVGYGSEAAFTRVFSRLTGEPPSTFRQRERRASA